MANSIVENNNNDEDERVINENSQLPSEDLDV